MEKLSKEELAKKIDHTLLKPEATPEQIIQLCEEAKKYGFYSVCVNSRYVELAKRQLAGSLVKICSVVGFPLGAIGTEAKAYEALKALLEGADEIDMVIWVGGIKAKLDEEVKKDIQRVVGVCRVYGAICKVIIETALLTNEEKERACNLVCEAKADFVKTSTGFIKDGGATVEDVKLMRRIVGHRAKIKAAGGIRTCKDAFAMLEAGADRLGMSASVQAMEELEKSNLSE